MKPEEPNFPAQGLKDFRFVPELPVAWKRKKYGEDEETTAMERYELRKMSKDQKFNIMLEYNKLFQKVMKVYKWKIGRDLS